MNDNCNESYKYKVYDHFLKCEECILIVNFFF